MAAISWLHLSDWHQKGPDFDRTVVRDALLEDLRQRRRFDPASESLDFIVFSGDATFSGKREEFDAVQRELFDPVLCAAGLPRERLFLVPGNHDLDRAAIYDLLPDSLRKPLTAVAEVLHWSDDERRRRCALQPFQDYEAFVAGYTGQASPAYASIRRFDLPGGTVALLGLNSAWMCGRHRGAGGRIEDQNHLVIGEPQIHKALHEIADAALRIVVFHHAFDWLASFDRPIIEPRLKAKAQIILWGHEHQPTVRTEVTANGLCVMIPAGAAYEERVAGDPTYTNAYNLVTVDLETGKGTVSLRRWNDPTGWIPDTLTCPNGRASFTLPDVEEAAQKRAAASRQQQQVAAEQRYRDLLLQSCDIINLANLPEDHLIAQRQLELRRLYVPLRARIESKAGAVVDERLFDALEQRRDQQRRGKAGKQETRTRAAIGERLARARRLVVLGDPGSGKTTLTRWIATACLLRLKQDPTWEALPDIRTLPETPWLPVIVRCRDLETDGAIDSLDAILQRTLRRAELDEAEATAVQHHLLVEIKADRTLLILDGLDELADPRRRARLCQQLEAIARAHPEMAMIVTSRIVGYREMGHRLGTGFEHLTLDDFNGEEKDRFAQRWCELVEAPESRQAAAASLIADIHSSDRIERLTGNPMLLATLALVKRRVGRLPQRRADLYGEAVQVLLNWRSDVDLPLDTREAMPQLEYLAYAMCDRGVQRLDEDEVLALFGELREKYPNLYAVQQHTPNDFLRLLERRTGLLIQAGLVRRNNHEVPVYEFRHLTFQEYLAACALVDGYHPGPDPKPPLAERIAPLAGRTTERPLRWSEEDTEPTVVESWRETLRLCVALCTSANVDPMLDAILTSQPGEAPGGARARAVQAAGCLADEPNAGEACARHIIAQLTAMIDNRDRTAHSTIAKTCQELAASRWSPVLTQALYHEFLTREPLKRGDIGRILRSLLPTARATAAVSSWLEEQAVHLRAADEPTATAAALEVMRIAYEQPVESDPGLVQALLHRLNGSPPLAHAAAWALYWLNDNNFIGPTPPWQPSAVRIETIISAIAKPETDPEAKFYLLYILANNPTEAAIDALGSRLTDQDPRRLTEILSALGEIRNRPVDPLIRPYLDSPASTARITALAALARPLDNVNRCLLTADIDGLRQWLDPRAPVPETQVAKAAHKLRLPVAEIRARYRTLAEHFGLRLEWESGAAEADDVRAPYAPGYDESLK